MPAPEPSPDLPFAGVAITTGGGESFVQRTWVVPREAAEIIAAFLGEPALTKLATADLIERVCLIGDEAVTL